MCTEACCPIQQGASYSMQPSCPVLGMVGQRSPMRGAASPIVGSERSACPCVVAVATQLTAKVCTYSGLRPVHCLVSRRPERSPASIRVWAKREAALQRCIACKCPVRQKKNHQLMPKPPAVLPSSGDPLGKRSAKRQCQGRATRPLTDSPYATTCV